MDLQVTLLLGVQELHPQPGWELVMPAEAGVMRVYRAIAQDCLGHVLSTRVLTAPVSLAQLAALSLPEKMDLLDKVTTCIRQTQAQQSRPDDQADCLGLKLTGDFLHCEHEHPWESWLLCVGWRLQCHCRLVWNLSKHGLPPHIHTAYSNATLPHATGMPAGS